MRLRTALSRWVPPLALMAVIFFLSAQPGLSSGLGVIDLVGRKLVHVAEYALLCWLWWRALRTVVGERPAILTALAIAVAYAATDELHQTLVPDRTGTPVDVAIDAVGATLAAVLIHRRSRTGSAGRRRDGRSSAASAEVVR